MKKIFRLAAVALSFSLLLCACKDSAADNEPTVNEPIDTQEEIDLNKQTKLNAISPTAYSRVTEIQLEPGTKISIIGRYTGDSFWSQVEAGAKEAIEDINNELGYTGSDKIVLTYNGPSNRDNVDEQINILDEELSRTPLAVGIAAIDTGACTLQFDLAAENNIPIITFDSGSEYQHVASHISTDNLAAASTAASKLAYAIEETGEVAIFVQDSLSMTASDRLQGFIDTLGQNFPNITIANIYRLDEYKTMANKIAIEKNSQLEDGAAPIEPASITQEDIVNWILEKNPNIKGIYATNLDTTQLVANVIADSGRTDLKIVGFDGGQEQLKLLENGIVEGLILQNPYGMGYATVIAAARVNSILGNDSYVDTGYVWVTKDNMNDTSIANMLY